MQSKGTVKKPAKISASELVLSAVFFLQQQNGVTANDITRYICEKRGCKQNIVKDEVKRVLEKATRNGIFSKKRGLYKIESEFGQKLFASKQQEPESKALKSESTIDDEGLNEMECDGLAIRDPFDHDFHGLDSPKTFDLDGSDFDMASGAGHHLQDSSAFSCDEETVYFDPNHQRRDNDDDDDDSDFLDEEDEDDDDEIDFFEDDPIVDPKPITKEHHPNNPKRNIETKKKPQSKVKGKRAKNKKIDLDEDMGDESDDNRGKKRKQKTSKTTSKKRRKQYKSDSEDEDFESNPEEGQDDGEMDLKEEDFHDPLKDENGSQEDINCISQSGGTDEIKTPKLDSRQVSPNLVESKTKEGQPIMKEDVNKQSDETNKEKTIEAEKENSQMSNKLDNPEILDGTCSSVNSQASPEQPPCEEQPHSVVKSRRRKNPQLNSCKSNRRASKSRKKYR